jgi:membrane-anchored protein YejM (alkaline phosphatase superfamily)
MSALERAYRTLTGKTANRRTWVQNFQFLELLATLFYMKRFLSIVPAPTEGAGKYRMKPSQAICIYFVIVPAPTVRG